MQNWMSVCEKPQARTQIDSQTRPAQKSLQGMSEAEIESGVTCDLNSPAMKLRGAYVTRLSAPVLSKISRYERVRATHSSFLP